MGGVQGRHVADRDDAADWDDVAVSAAAGVSLRGRRRRGRERLIRALLLGCGVVAIATTAGIVASLLSETVAFFRDVPMLDYLTGTKWHPTLKPASFGVLPLVWSTIFVALIGAAVAFPLGLGAAIYLSEYATPRFRRIVKPVLEILAGIPSVVFGYFALTFVSQSLLKKLIPGLGPFNALSAGIVVGIAIIPLVASISEDAMRAVPHSLREAGYAMGATKRRVATRIVVPAALSGIAAAFILGLSRAIGETMIVTIAAGQQPNLTADPTQSMQTISAYIVQVSLGDTPAGSVAYRSIFALGMTLFVMTLVLNMISLKIVRRFREQYE